MTSKTSLLEMTAEIVAAYVGHHDVPQEDLPELLQQTYAAICGIAGAEDEVVAANRPKPAVEIAKSITPDYVICLEDGKKLKMLKRHLKTAFGMTPEEYRKRWGLSPDYPMVAPNYARKRSSLAKDIGLGTRPRRTRRAKSAESGTGSKQVA